MADGIRIGVAMDTREFSGQARDLENDLERVSDALDDVARDGDKAGSKLEDSFRDTQQSTEKTERTFKDMADTIARESRDAGRKIDDGIGDGLRKADDGLGEFKDEARSTAREGAASFTGEWDDVGDIVQETLANAFAGFGPIGAAAGIAAAIGFGTLYAKIQADAEASEERVQSMYDQFLEAGQTWASEEMVNARIKELAGDTDEYNRALSTATDLGADVSQVLRAMAGDTTAYSNIVSDAEDSLSKMEQEQQNNINAGKGLDDVLQAQIDALKGSIKSWNNQSSEVDKARDKFNAVTDAMKNTRGQTGEVIRGLDGISRAVQNLPNGKVIKIKADTGTFISDVRYAIDRAGNIAKGGINVPVRATNSTGRVVY